MSNLNYTFFEEFKRLDKLCGELYKTPYGISNYINDMKAVPVSIYRNIPNWKTDLEQLIRLRHIRNHLAHEEGAFNEKICAQKDIEWSQNFHKRILKQSDPLALLHQYLMKQRKASKPPKYAEPEMETISEKREVKIKGSKEKDALILIISVIIIICACLLAGLGILAILTYKIIG